MIIKYYATHKDGFSKTTIKIRTYNKYYIQINFPFTRNKDNILFAEKYLDGSEKLFLSNDLKEKYRSYEKPN